MTELEKANEEIHRLKEGINKAFHSLHCWADGGNVSVHGIARDLKQLTKTKTDPWASGQCDGQGGVK